MDRDHSPDSCHDPSFPSIICPSPHLTCRSPAMRFHNRFLLLSPIRCLTRHPAVSGKSSPRSMAGKRQPCSIPASPPPHPLPSPIPWMTHPGVLLRYLPTVPLRGSIQRSITTAGSPAIRSAPGAIALAPTKSPLSFVLLPAMIAVFLFIRPREFR